MSDLLRFIVRYAGVLTLVVLEILALVLILMNNPYPHSTAVTTANDVVAWQNRKVSGVYEYFALSSTNAQLARENAELRNELASLQMLYERDEARENGAYLMRGTHYIPARVIQMERNSHHNYLTIDVGLLDGVREGMGVRGANGIVGIVGPVNNHNALVVPVIHPQSQISCIFKKDGYLCNLIWTGESAEMAELSDVALHEHAERGDTIVTSGLTDAFAADVPVGVVESCELREGDSYYTIRVRLNTDFRRLRYVQVVNRLDTKP